MPQTELAVKVALNPFATVAADANDITLTAADVANGNSFQCTGKEILIVQNSGASPYTVTVLSVADEKSRTGDHGPYTLAAGEFAVFTEGLTMGLGWRQTNGLVYLAANNAAVKFCVIRLPI